MSKYQEMIFSPEPIFSLFETGNMVTAQGPVLLIRIEPESKCSNLHTCAQIKKPPPMLPAPVLPKSCPSSYNFLSRANKAGCKEHLSEVVSVCLGGGSHTGDFLQ